MTAGILLDGQTVVSSASTSIEGAVKWSEMGEEQFPVSPSTHIRVTENDVRSINKTYLNCDQVYLN
jgi:hypothetical protein